MNVFADMFQTIITNLLLVGFFYLVAIGVFRYQTKQRLNRKVKRSINLKYYHQRIIRRLRNKS